MTRTEFDTERHALGLSIRRFAGLTGTHWTTVARWGREIPAVPGWVAPLLAAWRVAGVPDLADAR